MITQQSSIHAANVRITFQLFCWERNKLISTTNFVYLLLGLFATTSIDFV